MDSNPFVSSPGSISLIIAIVVVSLASFFNENLWRYLALEPYRMAETHQYHQIITAGFVHAGFGHLLVNVLTLYFFGPVLEQTLRLTSGNDIFLVVYFASLIIGNLYPFFKYRRTPEYVAIGASGAVSGIVFSFCLFYPFEPIYLFFAFRMPAIVFAVLYVVYSVVSMRNRIDNIGHEAHLAGALGGVIVTLIAAHEPIIENIRQYL